MLSWNMCIKLFLESPQSFSDDNVIGMELVNENNIEVHPLLYAFVQDLTCYKHHVCNASAMVKATWDLRYTALRDVDDEPVEDDAGEYHSIQRELKTNLSVVATLYF